MTTPTGEKPQITAALAVFVSEEFDTNDGEIHVLGKTDARRSLRWSDDHIGWIISSPNHKSDKERLISR